MRKWQKTYRCRSSVSELKNFGVLVGGITAGILGLLFPLVLHRSINLWFWGAGGLLMISGIGFPELLRPFYIVWMKVGHVLGWINTRIILGLFYFCILFPAGITMRFTGWDPMRRNFDPGAGTYRIPSRVPARDHFERPF